MAADIPSADRRGWGRPCTGRIVTITPLNMTLPVRAEVAVIFQRFILEAEERGFRFNRTRDDWGYACRHIRNDRSLPWSNHAWGLAVDLDATQNPQVTRLRTTFPRWIDELAARYGLRWGGDFSGLKDPMHFEFTGSPADARAITARLQGEEDDEMANLFETTTKFEEAVERAAARAVDKIMSKGTTGDEDGSIRAWAVKVDQTQAEVHQIRAQQTAILRAIERLVLEVGGQEPGPE